MKEVIDLDRTRRTREAETTKDATKWTPRDALLAMVEDIDAGKLSAVDMVQAVYRYKVDGKERFGYYSAGCNRLEAIGLMEEGKLLALENDGYER